MQQPEGEVGCLLVSLQSLKGRSVTKRESILFVIG